MPPKKIGSKRESAQDDKVSFSSMAREHEEPSYVLSQVVADYNVKAILNKFGDYLRDEDLKKRMPDYIVEGNL